LVLLVTLELEWMKLLVGRLLGVERKAIESHMAMPMINSILVLFGLG
jgi:hypothetical protein